MTALLNICATQIKRIEFFGSQETNILPVSLAEAKARNLDLNTGYQKIDTPSGPMYVVDREQVAANAGKRRYDMTAEEREIQKRMTPAFWVPQVTPEAEKPALTLPDPHTMCPQGDHALRLKQLRPLQLTLADEEAGETKASHRSGRYMCPACRRHLVNSGTQHALTKCGHVVCKECVTQFVAKEGACPACSTPCSPAKDVVKHLLITAIQTCNHGDGSSLDSLSRLVRIAD